MKLLTTIAALLLSFSAFSQDLIEYRDFKFYQNGSEISFEEVTELTKQYGVAKVAFKQGRRDFAASQSTLRATRRNLTNGALAYAGGYGAGAGLIFSMFQEEPIYFYLGLISAWEGYYSLRLMGTKKKFKKRADEKFMETAHKLNEAIQLGKGKWHFRVFPEF